MKIASHRDKCIHGLPEDYCALCNAQPSRDHPHKRIPRSSVRVSGDESTPLVQRTVSLSDAVFAGLFMGGCAGAIVGVGGGDLALGVVVALVVGVGWASYRHGQPLEQEVSSPVVEDVEDADSDDFLESYEWRRLRMEVIKARGARCECCGATRADGKTVINVDHIKPRRTHPELALDQTNLQVLCNVCNHGKGNWDQTDWRD